MSEPQTPPATPEKKQKERSPNYPAVSLRRALEYAQKFWDHDTRGTTLATRAAINLGFTAKSSAGLLALAAMKKFGLLLDEGTGETRKVRLSDSGIALLNPSSPNRRQLLKEAALKPTIYAELWEKFGANGFSEGAMRDHLVFERKFYDEAVKILIPTYRDTLDLAQLMAGDKVEEENAATEPEVEKLQQAAKPSIPCLPVTPAPPPPAPRTEQVAPLSHGLRYLSIPLGIGDAPIPVGISEEDFTLLLATLKLWKKRIVTQEYPKAAIWKNKDNDMPVSIIGMAGERDGVKYYQSSTGTGLPETELEFQ